VAFVFLAPLANEYPARDTVAGYGVRQHGIREQIIMSAKEKQDKKKQDKKNKLQKRGMELCGHMKVCFIRFIRWAFAVLRLKTMVWK
jgi:hypothetical protein